MKTPGWFALETHTSGFHHQTQTLRFQSNWKPKSCAVGVVWLVPRVCNGDGDVLRPWLLLLRDPPRLRLHKRQRLRPMLDVGCGLRPVQINRESPPSGDHGVLWPSQLTTGLFGS